MRRLALALFVAGALSGCAKNENTLVLPLILLSATAYAASS